MTCADVSFVVPTHNRPTYLAEAIASIRAQTISPREIIVVDNGNDSATASVLSPFAGSVRLVRSKYGSVQIARNTGFREANTTWVATLDDDDVLHPTFLQEALPLLDDRGVDIVSSDHRKFRGDVFEEDTNFEQAPSGYWDWVKHKGERTVIGRFPLAKLLQRIPVYPSTTIIRREFALSIGGYDPAMRGIPVEDIEFLVRALTHGNLGMVWKPLVSYRLHPGNDSASFVGQVIGRWRIFEHVRRTHRDLPAAFIAALDQDLPRRRVEIYKIAFRTGDRSLMTEVAPLLKTSDWTLEMRARKLIAAAPAPVRRHLRYGKSAEEI